MGLGRAEWLERAWTPYTLSPHLVLCVSSIRLFLIYIILPRYLVGKMSEFCELL